MRFSLLDFKMNHKSYMWWHKLYLPHLITVSTLRREIQNTKNACEHNFSF